MEVNASLRHNGQTGLHWAAYGGHLDTVKLLLERKALLDIKDESFGGTPVSWALYGWDNLPHEGAGYYEVVAILIAAGAPVKPEWLTREKVRADARMLAALSGELSR
jgi:ankyrin repeat protein